MQDSIRPEGILLTTPTPPEDVPKKYGYLEEEPDISDLLYKP